MCPVSKSSRTNLNDQESPYGNGQNFDYKIYSYHQDIELIESAKFCEDNDYSAVNERLTIINYTIFSLIPAYLFLRPTTHGLVYQIQKRQEWLNESLKI